jgi:hypothetical protein
MMRCGACDHPEREALDRALTDGTPSRAVARQFGLGRGVVSRHRSHSGAGLEPVPSGRDHFNEAIKQLSRATTDRQKLRCLEAIRAALALELRDHRRARAAIKAPNEDQLRTLEANVSAAWEAYEASTGLDTSLRALQGIREALGQLRAVMAKLEQPAEWITVEIRLHDANGGGLVGTTQWPAWAAFPGGVLQLTWPGAPSELEVASLTPDSVPHPNGGRKEGT